MTIRTRFLSSPAPEGAFRFALLALGLALLGTASGCSTTATAGLFDVPDPEIVYEGSAPNAGAGVLVIRDEEALATALAGLDPAYAGPPIDLDEFTLLRVVGREREDGCRQTLLREVATKNWRASVSVEERIPAKDCVCTDEFRPPRAWLVTVARAVRRAEVNVTDVVVPCADDEQPSEPAKEPVLILEGTWNAEPGARIISGADDYLEACAAIEAPGRCPELDFSEVRVIAVTGRPRENGCRQTALIEKSLSGDEALFVVEETYPGRGQMCTQIFRAPKVFLYRVPAEITRARVTTKERR